MALPALTPSVEEILADCEEIRRAPDWEPQPGGERLLLIGVLEHAFCVLEDWCDRRADSVLETALEAHRWLMSDAFPEAGSRKFTFAEICDHLGLETSYTRRALYERLDQELIAELSLTLLRRRAARSRPVGVTAVPA